MKRIACLLLPALLAACGGAQPRPPPPPPEPPPPVAPPTADEARLFLLRTEQKLRALTITASVADWESSTNLTDATEREAARTEAELMAFTGPAVREAGRYAGVAGLTEDERRKFALLRRASELPAPPSDAERAELAELAARMESLYGKGKYCPADGKPCRDLDQLSDVLAESRDPEQLREAWEGWHAVGKQLRPLYARYVTLANQGARSIGYADLGVLWRSRYDMSDAAFAADYERLWDQVKPLYDALHCHTRAKLVERYGPRTVPPDGPIPAHLLGNMWAQDWSNLYHDLEPYPGLGELDVTSALKNQRYDEERMVKLGEGFYTSLGLPPLPESFWQRSMLKRPAGREVVCHASAWDVLYNNDLRIKMCTKVNQEDLLTIHHELGHIYYFSQYYRLPFLFQSGANDGFHEAIGDAIALSVTPAYLKQMKLLERVPPGERGAINQLMQRALEKVAFLPFGKLVDAWRWKVFSGAIAEGDYNRSWWALRREVQGVAPPSARGEDAFDPGAKYHVPANVSYARYFLATVLQYQFHRAMCRTAGHEGPLHACSVYGNRQVGERLARMLALGAEKPWPDALEVLTGERTLDATAMLDYFAPLKQWLDTQNEGRRCGW